MTDHPYTFGDRVMTLDDEEGIYLLKRAQGATSYPHKVATPELPEGEWYAGDEISPLDNGPYKLATIAIDALRDGAEERAAAAVPTAMLFMPDVVRKIINAVLGGREDV